MLFLEQRPAALELHQLLIAPLGEALSKDGVRRLLVVPHGPLAYLPYLTFRTFGPVHQVWNYVIAGLWPLLLLLLEWRSLTGMQKRVAADAD